MGEPVVPGVFGVFFPSLSREILWKTGAVSRVRFAAQKTRALDTTPAFQPILLRRKRREGVAIRRVLGQAPGVYSWNSLPPTKNS